MDQLIEMNNLDIENIARKYIGTPFRHQGRSLQGMDCVGLIINVAHDLGISNFEYLNYGKDPKPEVMRKYLRELLDRQPLDMSNILPGDIFYISFLKHPQHLAIYTSKNTIIHAAYVFGKVTEHRLDTYWISRIKEIYRYRGIN